MAPTCSVQPLSREKSPHWLSNGNDPCTRLGNQFELFFKEQIPVFVLPGIPCSFDRSRHGTFGQVRDMVGFPVPAEIVPCAEVQDEVLRRIAEIPKAVINLFLDLVLDFPPIEGSIATRA